MTTIAATFKSIGTLFKTLEYSVDADLLRFLSNLCKNNLILMDLLKFFMVLH